jgi:signal transduction histidine kinase
LLRIAATLLILLFIQQTVQRVTQFKNTLWGLLTLTAGILVIRSIITIWDIPFSLAQFTLFSPELFSGMGISSLGMLLIDAALLLWWIRFLGHHHTYKNQHTPVPSTQQLVVAGAASGLGLLGLTFYMANLVRLIAAKSAIPFDVTDFFSLNLYTFFGFLALGAISVVYVMASQLLIRQLSKSLRIGLPYTLLLLTATGLAAITLFPFEPKAFQLAVLAWLILYVLSGYSFGKNILQIGNARLIFWMAWFSFTLAIVFQLENNRKEQVFRMQLAEKIAWQTDPSSEKVLHVVVSNLSHSFWEYNLDRFRQPLAAARLKDSIVKANFSGYLNRYETGLYIFDPQGQPVGQSKGLTFDTLSTIYELQGQRTSVKDLRFVESGTDQFAYLHRRHIQEPNGTLKAIVFMLSFPRRYKRLTMIPDLFRQWDQRSRPQSPHYAYAVYDKGVLIASVQDYPFSRKLDTDDLSFQESKWINQNGYSELWYRQHKDRTIIVVRKYNSLLSGLTIFSYQFAVLLLLIGLIRLLQVTSVLRISKNSIRRFVQLTIRQQIYATILLLVLVSFAVIGYVTVQFYLDRFERSNQERLNRTLLVMAEDLKKSPDSLTGIWNPAIEQNDILPVALEKLAQLHQADVNLYDPSGKLVAASQPLIYQKGILSNRMDAHAYYQLTANRKTRHTQVEQIGQLTYQSLYHPVLGPQQELLGFIHLPYYASTRIKNQEISFFLITLMNLIAFIFLVAGTISVLLTTRITASLRWIGQMMQLVTIGKHNQEIQWNRNDEIGTLVAEYNKMVQKLEKSAADLARSEREGAWREMARQVAHEIKNPLTPMKLSIQYLQRAVDQGNGNLPELTRNVAHTLVEQIGHLSKIASEFAQFAQIGQVKNETFDVHEVLQSLILLHQSREDLQIIWLPEKEGIWLHADKTQINRLFTNLIKNAVEAIPDGISGKVSISEKVEDGNVVIHIEDNGSGVSPEMAQRIFLPNFTTKSSGTGLGLAICKGIVEKMQGEIWFRSEPGIGTSFFVQLPLSTPPPIL